MARRKAGLLSDASTVVDQEFAQQLVERATQQGVKLTVPGGLLDSFIRANVSDKRLGSQLWRLRVDTDSR